MEYGMTEETPPPRHRGTIELRARQSGPDRLEFAIQPIHVSALGWVFLVLFSGIFVYAASLSREPTIILFVAIFFMLVLFVTWKAPHWVMGYVIVDRAAGRIDVVDKGIAIPLLNAPSIPDRTETYPLRELKAVRTYRNVRTIPTSEGQTSESGWELSLEFSDGRIVPLTLQSNAKSAEESAKMIAEFSKVPYFTGKPEQMLREESQKAAGKLTAAGRVVGFLFFGLFLAAGLFLLYTAHKTGSEALASTEWPDTSGFVTYSDIHESSDSDGTTYGADVRYTYDVSGVGYRGDRIFIGEYSTSSYSWAAGYVEKYPVDAEVKVYYDPAEPGRSVLEPGLDWFGVGLFFIMGLAFTAAGGFGSLYILKA
jgi:hypothetical protein